MNKEVQIRKETAARGKKDPRVLLILIFDFEVFFFFSGRFFENFFFPKSVTEVSFSNLN